MLGHGAGALTLSLLSLHLWQAFDSLPLKTIVRDTLREDSRNDFRIRNVQVEESHVDGRDGGDNGRR
jgi:hypothetical protein